MTRPLQGVKALLYDVFGTVVDWQGSVHRQLEAKVGQQNDDDSGGFVKTSVLKRANPC